MLALAILYGISIVWLVYEAHTAPVLPDQFYESRLDRLEGGHDARPVVSPSLHSPLANGLTQENPIDR